METSAARQALSFLGAALILIAYAGHQMNWMNSRKAAYNLFNAIGSGVLAYIAFRPFQLGFVVLEVTWSLLSFYAFLRPRAEEQ